MSKFVSFLKNKWKEIIIAVVCIIAIVLTTVLYSISTSNHIFEESATHLEEIAAQITDKFRREAESNRTTLHAIKHYINDTVDKMDSPDKKQELNYFFTSEDHARNLTDIVFISEDEKIKETADGEEYYIKCKSGLESEGHKSRELKTRRSLKDILATVTDSSAIKNGGVLCEDENGEVFLMFAVDYRDNEYGSCGHSYNYDGFKYYAAGFLYDAKDMVKLLTVEAFDGNGISYITRSTGLIVLQTGSPHDGGDSFSNIINYIDFLGGKSIELKNKTIEEIKKDFTNTSEGGATTQKADTLLIYDKEVGVEYYMTYQPVGFDNWMFVGLVPSKIINGSMNDFRLQTIAIFSGMFIIVGIVIIWFIVANNRRKIKLQKLETEKEISARNALLDLMTMNSNDIIILFSPDDFSAKYVSANITQVLGLDYDAVVKDMHAILDASLNVHNAFTTEGLKKLPYGRTWEIDLQMQNVKTNEPYWFHMTMYRSTYNNEDRFILMLTDRTKERAMSESLEEALKLAKSANDAKSNFLSNMSHDIRTPMNAIVGFTTLLAKDAENPEKVREYVKKISFSSHHLLSLINDILDMSKIESGKTHLNAEDFDLSLLFEEIYTMISPQAKVKGHEFKITTRGKLPETVNADRMRINQVIINLLSNAIKYTPDNGHIELDVEALENNIPNYAHVRITVKDDGIGMSHKFTERIFEPFTREESEKTKGIQGTGLGMAIVKNIIDLMGGTISVESELGKGSTFVIELELLIAGLEEKAERSFWRKNNVTRVLVVDDDENVCINVKAVMEDTGVKIDYALSGIQAIVKISENNKAHKDYSVVLLDWKMPEMDGVETARNIRKIIGSEVPIIVLTSYDFDDIEDKAKEAGVDAFLSKPFFLTNFRNTIETLKKDDSDEAVEIKPESTSLAGLKVLAAEDNEINAEILVDLLDIEGATCDVVTNGKEVAAIFENSAIDQYDVIFMDVQMPIMNGYDATRAIRACNHPRAKTIPIIAMTANAFEDDIKQALDSGMNAHIAKPVDMDKLKLIVSKYFSDKQLGSNDQ